MKKTLTVWFAVNKNGFIGIYSDEPKRNIETGKWESKFPFINSLIYDQICQLVEKAKLDWNKEPECISFQFDS